MIAVLRLGHRLSRDKRITTHVALVARAFGADKIIISTRDTKIEENISSICRRFGGDFEIATGADYKKIIKHWKGIVVHLTMYGEKLDVVDKIDSKHGVTISEAENIFNRFPHSSLSKLSSSPASEHALANCSSISLRLKSLGWVLQA